MKYYSAAVLSLTLILSSCGQPAHLTQLPEASTAASAEHPVLAEQGTRNIDQRGGELKFGHTRLIIPEGAVTKPTEFLVKTLPAPQYPLTLPPVKGVYGNYLIGEVQGRQVSQVLRISSNASMIPKGSSLVIKAVGRSGGKDATDIVFGIPEGSNDITYLGAYKNADEYRVQNVLGGINAPAKSVMIYVVRADSAIFEENCRALGGIADPNCSLANNELPTGTMSAQA